MWPLAERSLRTPFFFLLLTGVPLAALVWLGWHFLQLDRDLERRRQRERLENASELLARDLHDKLQALLEVLPEPDRSRLAVPTDGVFFQLRGGRVADRSGVPLPFYPIRTRPAERLSPSLLQAERLEFDDRCDLALRRYRQLADDADSEVRGGALLRTARCLRKLRREAEALEIYGRLAALKDANVGGMPAELVARRERLALLTAAGDQGRARVEGQLLRELLVNGTFAIDRGTFEFLSEPFRLGPESIPNLPFALAAEGSSLRVYGEPCGRVAEIVGHTSVLTLWCRTRDESVNVLLLPAERLLGPLHRSAEVMQVTFDVEDSGGTRVWAGSAAGTEGFTRHLSDVGLPWQLHVQGTDVPGTAVHISRRRLVAGAGLALMVVTVGAAAFFVFRGVARELEVASLQAEFISTVSHEFRTPLTAMNHLTEMLQEGAVPGERVDQYYSALHRETRRLHRLVEGLLDFKRFEAGRHAYRMEPIQPQEAVRQVLDDYATGAESHRLHAVLKAADVTIVGDCQALAAAVSNLLDNALKYAPADTPVSIAVEPRGRMLGISVEDRGPGMTRRERRRVFRKFVRGAAAQHGSVKGTGIGLAIVQAVVKAHGGRVDLETAPGQGSRFTLLLPVIGHR